MKLQGIILAFAAICVCSGASGSGSEDAGVTTWIGRDASCGQTPFARCGSREPNGGRAAVRHNNQLIEPRIAPASLTSGPLPRFTRVGDVAKLPSLLPASKLLGPASIPPSSAPDVVGAFRFLCGPGQLTYDDPIVYPGEPGKAHLHQFFGNLEANAHSSYESLRTSGESTCQNELNRSAYWMPAMLDGKGHVVRPDFVSIYYKRRPKTDPFCTKAAKGCVGIPRGLRFVFGWDQTRPNEPQPENAVHTNFKCVEGWNATTATFRDMVEPMKVCKPGQWLNATISTPECWNGVDLDTPDHRSHLAEMRRDRNTGQVSCPASHPWVIPQFTMGVAYSIETGDRPELWHLSSDAMLPEKLRRPGASFHSDYFEAWDEDIRLRWEAACLDRQLNCSDGDLGDGQIMVRGKYYPNKQIAPRLVEIPHQIGRDGAHAHQ